MNINSILSVNANSKNRKDISQITYFNNNEKRYYLKITQN